MQPCVDVLGVNHQEILEKSDSIERFAEYGDTENKEIIIRKRPIAEASIESCNISR